MKDEEIDEALRKASRVPSKAGAGIAKTHCRLDPSVVGAGTPTAAELDINRRTGPGLRDRCGGGSRANRVRRHWKAGYMGARY